MAKKIFGNISSNILTNFFIFKIGGIIAKKNMLIGAREKKKTDQKKREKEKKIINRKEKEKQKKIKMLKNLESPSLIFLCPCF